MSNGENCGGSAQNRLHDLAAYDSLPPEVRRVLADSPINLGGGSARRLLRKYDAKETAQTTKEFIRDYMLGGESESTRAKWTYHISARKPGYLTVGIHDGRTHPQADKDYPWPDYQLNPKRTRAVNIMRGRLAKVST